MSLRAGLYASRFVTRNTPSRRRPYSSASKNTYEHLLISTPKTGVDQITLNRPKKLNALNTSLFVELNEALRASDGNDSVGAIVLTGSVKAFAAGADIAEMQDLTFGSAYATNFIASWSAATSTLAKPLIAAVNGHALGGGCELAMMADIIYCSASANFGQPEISLGTIPGAGGSQRLTRAIGKSRAMEMILTGKMINGRKAEQWGLAAQCFETPEECIEGALSVAARIASLSRVATKAAKEVVNKSQDLPLREGIEYERRLFHGLFGSEDQKIGMKAFVAKDRQPKWSHS